MRSYGQQFVLMLLRGYKWAVSPLFPPACRYVPTCSEYAMEAVERYGAVRGTWMAVWRVMRCHPLARGGFDPVVKRVPQETARNVELRSTDSRGRLSPHESSSCRHFAGKSARATQT